MAAEHLTELAPDDPGADLGTLAVMPDVVDVRRHAGVAALLGVAASAIAIAYLARATQTGSLLDWSLTLVMGALGAFWLVGFVDARTPLLVADSHGVRVRLARSWHGLPWSAVHHVEHLPRRGLRADGRLAVAPHNPELFLSGLGAAARRHAALARLLHGSELSVPLGISTRVIGSGPDLTASLVDLVRDRAKVVEIGPGEELGTGLDRDGASSDSAAQDTVPTAEPAAGLPSVVASATPAPLRESVSGRRAEVHRTIDDEPAPEPTGGRELRRPGAVSLVEETETWGERVRPIARAGDPVAPLVIDDFALRPADDPVIGPEVAAARTRLGLSIDQLAQRTRIRPHVLESIEVDDFEACGGDFYARGHLRTVARILGVDATALLAAYDERYAHAPINARRVFEAELATGTHGPIRGTRGGPNWSVLVAVVMALVLCWSVARLVMDAPADLRSEVPVLNGSGGPQGAATSLLADKVPVVVRAVNGGARVVVRDGAGDVVFAGNLAVGQSHELKASPPIRVQSSDGAVSVSVDGARPRPVGEPGVAGQGTFVAR